MLDRSLLGLLTPTLQRLAGALVRAGIGADAVTWAGFALASLPITVAIGRGAVWPRFIAAWQSPETQTVLRAVLARLGKG